MSVSHIETFVRSAHEQHSQVDINASLLKAVTEILRELKRMDHDIHSAKRAASRRF
jgi:hypothetical protein